MFKLSREKFEVAQLKALLVNPTHGATVCFEGWVRNHNEGREVLRLEYEAYEALALKEGAAIIERAKELFRIDTIICVHRMGLLEIGEAAVWVGAASPHRREAFLACSHVIDEVKSRVPIWKYEHYTIGEPEWVRCEACASHASHHEHGPDKVHLCATHT